MTFSTAAVRIASVLAVFAVFAASCEKAVEPAAPDEEKTDPTPKPDPTPEPEPETTYEITATEVTTHSARVKVDITGTVPEYYAGIVTREEFDRLGSDEALVKDIIEDLRETAELYEADDYAAFIKENFVHDKSPLDGFITDLEGDTDYYAYAFTWKTGYLDGTSLTKTAFRTLKAEPVDCSFVIEVSGITANNAAVKITPSNTECTYFWDCVSAEDYAGYGGDDGIIAANVDLIRRAVEIYQISGRNVDFSYFLVSGAEKGNFDKLEPGTEYVVFAFGLDPSGTGTTKVYRQNFTSKGPEPSSMTFTAQAYDIKFNGARIRFTPSVDNETYFTDCMDYETFSEFKDDKELTDWVIANAGSSISSFLTSGEHVVDASGLLVSKSKYVAYAFGYSGGVTTAVTKVEFATPEMPTGSKASVEISCKTVDGGTGNYADYPGQKIAELTLTPSGNAEHWYVGAYATLDGYDDYNIAEALHMKGYTDKKAIAFPLSRDIVVAAVAFDSSGRAGALSKISIGKDGTVTKSAALKSLKFGRAQEMTPLEAISD